MVGKLKTLHLHNSESNSVDSQKLELSSFFHSVSSPIVLFQVQSESGDLYDQNSLGTNFFNVVISFGY